MTYLNIHYSEATTEANYLVNYIQAWKQPQTTSAGVSRCHLRFSGKLLCCTEAREGEAGKPKRGAGTMAAGPGVSIQGGSPARELTLSVQQAGNQTHVDRAKTEEVTGKNTNPCLFCFGLINQEAQANIG